MIAHEKIAMALHKQMALQAQMTIFGLTEASTALQPRLGDPDSTVYDPALGICLRASLGFVGQSCAHSPVVTSPSMAEKQRKPTAAASTACCDSGFEDVFHSRYHSTRRQGPAPVTGVAA